MQETFPHDRPVESYRALLPSGYHGAEHVRRSGGEFLKVNHALGGYENIADELVEPLVRGGLILPIVESDQHVDYYKVPDGALSLSGFLNSTFADARGEEKRELVISSIANRFKQLASHGIAIEKYSGLTRFDICLGERLKPIILPLGTMIYESDSPTATEKNMRSYRELMTNIITDAAPEEVDFLVQQRDKWSA